MSRPKLAVIAIGGNSLIKDEAHVSIEDQYDAAHTTSEHIADMVEQGWQVVIGHGNGPQVGYILRSSEIAARYEHLPEVPLDVCGAETEGFIGYALQQTLQNILYHRKINKNVTTVITQTLVDLDDPAFKTPTKPIGGFMTREEAERRHRELGWDVVEDAGRGWRRVVASPLPKEIVEFDTIRTILKRGIMVIAAGGGGIPVADVGDGEYRGVPAVIDKDYAASLLARRLKADLFVISTTVEKVALNFGKPDQRWLDRVTMAEMQGWLDEGIHFARGSMAPKVQACLWYLADGGKEAIITNPENIGRALRGETGTHILPA